MIIVEGLIIIHSLTWGSFSLCSFKKNKRFTWILILLLETSHLFSSWTSSHLNWNFLFLEDIMLWWSDRHCTKPISRKPLWQILLIISIVRMFLNLSPLCYLLLCWQLSWWYVLATSKGVSIMQNLCCRTASSFYFVIRLWSLCKF